MEDDKTMALAPYTTDEEYIEYFNQLIQKHYAIDCRLVEGEVFTWELVRKYWEAGCRIIRGITCHT